MGGNFKKIVTYGTKCFVRYSWNVRYLGCPLLGGFTVVLIICLATIISYYHLVSLHEKNRQPASDYISTSVSRPYEV